MTFAIAFANPLYPRLTEKTGQVKAVKKNVMALSISSKHEQMCKTIRPPVTFHLHIFKIIIKTTQVYFMLIHFRSIDGLAVLFILYDCDEDRCSCLKDKIIYLVKYLNMNR